MLVRTLVQDESATRESCHRCSFTSYSCSIITINGGGENRNPFPGSVEGLVVKTEEISMVVSFLFLKSGLPGGVRNLGPRVFGLIARGHDSTLTVLWGISGPEVLIRESDGDDYKPRSSKK